ncbi:isomerase [Aureococcus anophagefferens]|nr:isomerase [Aureococcus anophagefferens]
MGEAADAPVAAPRTAEPTSPKSAARRRWTRVASQRTLSDAPAAAPQTGKRVTKVLYLARHGEGVHEIAAEVERDVAHAAALARDPAAEKPADLADPAGEEFFNAGLTDRGRAQSARAAEEPDALLARPHYPRPEAFFASPLHRTLETATILADGRVEVPVVAVDALREQRGGLPCDERDRADVVAADFPTVDASTIAAADDASPDGYVLREALVEDEAALAARAGGAVAWLRSLPFESVCLVSHRRLLRAVVRHTGPWLQARDARGGELEEVFPASEVRVVRVTWGASGLLERVVARSLGDAMRDSDAETFAAFERARAALGAVRNDALAAEVDALKARALDALFAGGDAGDRAADAFRRVLPAPGPGAQATPRAARRVRLLLARAARLDGAFRAKMAFLVSTFNDAPSSAAIAERLGLDPAAWPLGLHDSRLGVNVIRLAFGPPKSLGRALEKKLGSLKDLNRCVVEAHCPYTAAFFLAGLKATFPVVAVKNKHKQVVIAQPPDLHCNVDLGGGFLGEVQIILAYCLQIKHTIHAYYQLLRADAVDLVLEPHRGTSGEAVFDEFTRMRELARARGLSASSGLAESTRSVGTT